MDGVERLTDLADLVVTRGLDRIGGPLGDLLGRGTPQGSGLGQLAHHRGQARLGHATGRVAQTVQTADHDAAQTEGHDHGADQRQHHQDEFAAGRPEQQGALGRDGLVDGGVDPLLHRPQQLLPVRRGLDPLLRGDIDVLVDTGAADAVLQSAGLQCLLAGEGALQHGPPLTGAEAVQGPDGLGVAEAAGVEGPSRGGGEAARRLRAHDRDLLLSRVLGCFGEGGGGADPVGDVGVDTVGLGDAVPVADQVGDHDPVAEGERGDGAAARARLGAQGHQLLHGALDAVQHDLGVLRDLGQVRDPLTEAGDAPVGRLGTLAERVQVSLAGDERGRRDPFVLQMLGQLRRSGGGFDHVGQPVGLQRLAGRRSEGQPREGDGHRQGRGHEQGEAAIDFH